MIGFLATITGVVELERKFTITVPAAVRERVRLAVQRSTIEVQRHVKRDKLSGAPPGLLNVRTGTLRRSVNQRVEETTEGFKGSVGTNVHYGAYHELGTSRLPERPFLRSSLEDMREQITRNLTAAMSGVGR